MPELTGMPAVFFSACILFVFLLAGKLLRVKVKLLQTLFLPSSIIGGFLAMAAGPFGFDVLPAWVSAEWSKMPGLLINVVFACLFLGQRKHRFPVTVIRLQTQAI